MMRDKCDQKQEAPIDKGYYGTKIRGTTLLVMIKKRAMVL